MQSWTLLRLFVTFPVEIWGHQFVARAESNSLAPKCKCVPGQSCWPSEAEWNAFSLCLRGGLIKNEPIAQACYPGPTLDMNECAYVTKMWSDQDFQTSNPVGRPYPYNITCAPVNYAHGQKPTTCGLGSLPTYAVNATSRADIRATLFHAQRYHVRLVVSGTGHDLLGRSDGFGGLELWLHYFKNGIDFHKTYRSQNKCSKSGWAGSAIKINGNYQWRDVYKVAKANNVIAVGGGALSPGAIGGWPSGGGHGPATRNYGLGADQILEAEVMLADGRVVTVNHCENVDLFRAMRGGGPGYGVTLSSTIKTHPNVNVVTAHHFAMAPLENTRENTDLLDAVAVLLQQLPELSDAGFAGYGYWFRNFPTVFMGNATSGYSHGFWTVGKDTDEAEKGWAVVRKALGKFDGKLLMQESVATYSDYWSFYDAESGLYDPTGETSVLTSRLIDRKAVQEYSRVRDAVEVISGTPENRGASNVILLVSGGQVFKDGTDKTSGLHPAWRRSPFVIVSGQSIPKPATLAQRQEADDEITFVRGSATKWLAPDTGGYMNEGDRNDPDFKKSFYGSFYEDHLKVKQKYDPTGVFYCTTCVGSDAFVERPDGPLCEV